MLTALTSGLRFRLAFALAIFAALCFVAPPAAQAVGHGKNTLDCLARADLVNHGRSALNHSAGHADHSGHATPAGNHHMTCCALYCLSALAVEPGGVSLPIAIDAAPVAAHETRAASRISERPDKPPISPLFV